MAEISFCRIAFSGRKCYHTISINESFAKGLQYMTNERESFGRLLAKLRSEKEISQKELAQKLYVTASCVCKWEKGTNEPDLKLKIKIAELLEVPLESLLSPAELLLKEEFLKEKRPDHSTQESDSASSPPPHRRRVLVYALAGLITLTTILLVFCLVFSRVRIFRQDYVADKAWGQVYEMAYLTLDEMDSEATAQYAQEIRLQWETGALVPTQTDIVKVSFYKGFFKPSKNAIPYCNIYLLHEEDGKESE